LRGYLQGQTALTVLSAKLTPEQMKEDARPNWETLIPYRRVLHTRIAALTEASGPAIEVFLAGTLACAVLCGRRKAASGTAGMTAWVAAIRSWVSKILAGSEPDLPLALKIMFGVPRMIAAVFTLLAALLIVACFAGLLALVVLVLLPAFAEVAPLLYLPVMLLLTCPLILWSVSQWRRFRASTRADPAQGTDNSRRRPWLALGTLVALAILVGTRAYLPKDKVPAGSTVKWRAYDGSPSVGAIYESLQSLVLSGEPAEQLATLRKRATAVLEGLPLEKRKNIFTALPVREEDSPGNYVIEMRDGKATYCYCDEIGKKIPCWPDIK
jgi:hypothetical protein